MLVVGLTGGIGAGKSSMAMLLAERGAEIIDADELGRDALRPGEPAWHSVVNHFGEGILQPGSTEIDRGHLAKIVFKDPNELVALNSIVHPVILGGIAEHLDRLRRTDSIVVLDAALILEIGLDEMVDVLVAVTADRAARSDRLRHDRSMSDADIEGRMSSQIDPNEAVTRADIVVTNDGSREDLSREADRVWVELIARRRRASPR
jgi:dephospho-CoA kinase